MEPVSTVAAVAGVFAALINARGRSRTQQNRAREAARADHIRVLPPGSVVWDGGERGIVIAVGSPVGTVEGEHAGDS